ncbi:probable insulin-like peptide 5 [Drosophila guanche]|uniref:Blast:Probable insulin-like peptide 5 n=1 Tax=Drosophila guanche TaxID=7266 RepID=A0A3B0JZH5_DROGU|nr:probable insulin-like peptide 5 [Drosophila guanche]SPP87454.1 blast:Probable insulin-like peptide 5 [Drosophila guanche]
MHPQPKEHLGRQQLVFSAHQRATPDTPETMANSSKLQTLVSVLLLLLVSLCSWSPANAVPSKRSSRLCGDKLSEALDMMCPNGFNARIPHKRGLLDLFDYVDHMAEPGLDDDDAAASVGALLPEGVRLPWRHSSLMTTRRQMRGIVNECCAKPCNYNEIQAYCK